MSEIPEKSEVKVAVSELMTAFDEFANSHVKRASEHEDRLDKLETRLNRPGLTAGPNRSGSIEEKAWVNFIRKGVERMSDQLEIKSLITGESTRGGYLAPPEFVKEVLKAVVEYSPIRQAARVATTNAGAVILPKRTGRVTSSWVGEIETRTETAPAYGQDEIPIK